MSFEAVTVKLTELDGTTKTYYGHDSSAWICQTCRQDPSKLKAARIAAGMPEKPSMPEQYELDLEGQHG
jgi:hypothetical protein